jgi:hypothetical protein
MRLIFYIFSVAAEDEQTQKKGATTVVFNVGPDNIPDPEAHERLVPLLASMAVKIGCLHFCYEPSELMTFTMSTFMKNLESQTRARFRYHSGAYTRPLRIAADSITRLNPHHGTDFDLL